MIGIFHTQNTSLPYGPWKAKKEDDSDDIEETWNLRFNARDRGGDVERYNNSINETEFVSSYFSLGIKRRTFHGWIWVKSFEWTLESGRE